MKKISALLILVIFIPAIAWTGEIHGTIRKGMSSVAGVTIKIKYGNLVYSKNRQVLFI